MSEQISEVECADQAGVLHDADELDDRGDVRPWSSRAAWGEEMFDRWAA